MDENSRNTSSILQQLKKFLDQSKEPYEAYKAAEKNVKKDRWL